MPLRQSNLFSASRNVIVILSLNLSIIHIILITVIHIIGG